MKLSPCSGHSIRLTLVQLEDRTTPSTITVRFDSTYDPTGFTRNPEVMAVLNRAAAEITSQINDQLNPIISGNGNSWSANVINPFTQTVLSIPNLYVAQNEIVVYVGGGALAGGALGLAGGGAYWASGSQAWLDNIKTRGQVGAANGSDFSTWGGFLGFNANVNWHFGTGAPPANKYDLQSVATHELMHIFGFGLGNASFTRYTGSGSFTGPNVSAVAGSVRMASNGGDHFAGVGQPGGVWSVMNESIMPGQKKGMTSLEYAALRDIGWSSPIVSAAPTPPTPSPGASPVVTTSQVQSAPVATKNALAIGSEQGSPSWLQVYGSGGQVLFNGPVIDAGFTGGIRAATGDINGDGVVDYVVAAGPGGAPVVHVIDGRTGSLMRAFYAYDPAFTGGVYVAVGDVTGDGRVDIVTGAGAGGGPHVKVFESVTGSELIGFFGINDPTFRGGVRVAVGDINRDGYADIVASAGEGGGPRLSIWSGATITQYRIPTNLVPDFFAYEATLNNGAYVAVGDLNGDGDLEIITGAGKGGGPRVSAFSSRDILAGRFYRVADFFVGSPFSGTGVRVAAADLNGDGIDDVITGPGPVSDGTIRVYAGSLFGVNLSAPYFAASNPNWALAGAFVG